MHKKQNHQNKKRVIVVSFKHQIEIMKKIIILQILGMFSLLLVACGSQETTSQTNNISEVESTEAAPQTVTTDTAQITGEFSFKIIEGEFSPMTTVSVLSNGQEYLVDEIVGGATLIEKSEFETMGIPSTAISACGAWWAGGGDYFYLTQSNNQLIVYAGWLDEMEEQDNGYHWEEVNRFP